LGSHPGDNPLKAINVDADSRTLLSS